MYERIIKMFTDPNDYWNGVMAEPGDIKSLLMPQMIILAAVPAAATFVGTIFRSLFYGYGFIRFGFGGVFMGALFGMILQYAMSIGLWIMLGFIIDAFAPSFSAQKDIGQSMKLAAGAVIPGWLGSALSVLPFGFLGALGGLAGFGYGAYLLFKGLPIMNGTPAEKAAGYTILSIVILIVVGSIVFMMASCPMRCFTPTIVVPGL
jgi:hypothetical protein